MPRRRRAVRALAALALLAAGAAAVPSCWPVVKPWDALVRREVRVRPVTLRVEDASTGRPLPGVRVVYGLDAHAVTILPWPLALIRMESAYWDGAWLLEAAVLQTDAAGEVRIPERRAVMDGRSRVGHETFFVNLAHLHAPAAAASSTDEGVRAMLVELHRGDAGAFITPDGNRAGAVIEVSNGDAPPPGTYEEPPGAPYARLRLWRDSFAKPAERLAVRLGAAP